MNREVYDGSIWRDSIFWAVIAIGFMPLVMSLFMDNVDIPWLIISVPAIMLLLFFVGGRHKEYNRVEVTDNGIEVNNIFSDKYYFSLRFKDIKFAEFGVPMGRHSAPNIVIYTVDNQKFTLFLRLLREQDIKRLLTQIIIHIRFVDIADIERYIGLKKGLRQINHGVHISKLRDFSSLQYFRPTISNTTKWTIVIEVVVIIILLATEYYFEKLFIASSICAVGFALITYAVHSQECYVALSNSRLFTISRFSGKTNSINTLDDIESIYFTKWIDGVTRIILYNNTEIKSIRFISLNDTEINKLKDQLESRGIKTYIL